MTSALPCVSLDTLAPYAKGVVLGEGGFGKVFLMNKADLGVAPLGMEAIHASLPPRFAVKILNALPDVHAEEDEVRAQALAATACGCMPAIYGCATAYNPHHGDYSRAIFMDYIKGKDLGKLLTDADKHRGEASFGLRKALPTIATGLVSALTALHEHGLVHRDVKPENVVIDADGRFWLLDVGVACGIPPTREGLGDAAVAACIMSYASGTMITVHPVVFGLHFLNMFGLSPGHAQTEAMATLVVPWMMRLSDWWSAAITFAMAAQVGYRLRTKGGEEVAIHDLNSEAASTFREPQTRHTLKGARDGLLHHMKAIRTQTVSVCNFAAAHVTDPDSQRAIGFLRCVVNLDRTTDLVGPPDGRSMFGFSALRDDPRAQVLVDHAVYVQRVLEHTAHEECGSGIAAVRAETEADLARDEEISRKADEDRRAAREAEAREADVIADEVRAFMDAKAQEGLPFEDAKAAAMAEFRSKYHIALLLGAIYQNKDRYEELLADPDGSKGTATYRSTGTFVFEPASDTEKARRSVPAFLR